MRRIAAFLAAAFTLLPGVPASASCVVPGLGVQPYQVRAGGRVRVEVPGVCRDTAPPPGTSPAPTPPLTVRISLTRGHQSIVLGTITRHGDAPAHAWLRIPASAQPGQWTLRNDQGFRAVPITVERATLPRTDFNNNAAAAAVGVWLLVAGSALVCVRLPLRSAARRA